MEPKIRERLNDLATEAPKGLEVPRTLVRRARRRMALTVAASACAVAIVAVGAFAGARAIGNNTLQPATPTPSLGIFEQARGWIAIAARRSRRWIPPTRRGPSCCPLRAGPRSRGPVTAPSS
jgi:hypothetical protein